MITTAKIISYKDNQLVLNMDERIDREILQKRVGAVSVILHDGRTITADQRKKIFAIIRDIAEWSGTEPEDLRSFLTWDFVSMTDGEYFSLSGVDMSKAKDFINYLIKFCFVHNVPTKRPLIEQSDDIGKYLYYCLEHRRCAICNAKAQVHHVDRIGMGNNRKDVVHKDLRAIALCELHHKQAHNDEKALFEKYKVFGVKLDDYLVYKLKL